MQSPVQVFWVKLNMMGVQRVIVAATVVAIAGFTVPTEFASSGGQLSVTLTLAEGTVSGVKARFYNGMMPGPTLRVKAGDVMNIQLVNSLPSCTHPGDHNTLRDPCVTNLVERFDIEPFSDSSAK